MRRALVILALVLVGGAAAWYYAAHTPAVQRQNSSATVLKAGDEKLYPDPVKTPGDILTTDTSTICQPAYYRSVKDVSDDIKKAIYKKYGLRYPQAKEKYEVDRLIPIELGGSNDPKNLWPQAGASPGYKQKNAVDDFLHAQVCTGQMTLEEAQYKVQTDWYAVYLAISK